MEVSEAFFKLCKLHQLIGDPPLNQLPGLWVCSVGDWKVKVNGTATEIEGIPRFHAAAYFKDSWMPALLFSPRGGIQLGGPQDGVPAEDALITALDREIAKREKGGA